MESGFFIIFALAYGIYLIYLVFKIGKDSLKYKPESLFSHAKWLVIAEIIFVIAAPLIGFIRANSYPPEFPFSPKHLATLIFLVNIAIISYWSSRYFKHELTPIVSALVSIGMMQGIVLSVILLIHFGSYTFMGVIFPLFGFELIAPLICIFLYSRELFYHHQYFQEKFTKKEVDFKNPVLRVLAKKSLMTKNFLAFVLLFPFFFIQQLILTLFGQAPDAAIRVFVESCGFTFSDPAFCPPPSGHYLCSVAAHGNKNLVKPIRKGLRGQSLIVVNRQLLIANAFEQWLEENFPKSHIKLRRFYDSLNIPVDKWGEIPWVANLLYIMMKPLEWFFLLWLYLFDKNPENRIAMQYLPEKKETFEDFGEDTKLGWINSQTCGQTRIQGERQIL